jgi:hypothetical protein
MTFSREQIAAAKQGTHKISWQPNGKPEECRAVRVKGDFVYVVPVEASDRWSSNGKIQPVRLNGTASRLLIENRYR